MRYRDRVLERSRKLADKETSADSPPPRDRLAEHVASSAAEGFRLMQAFAAIESADRRRLVIELAEALANQTQPQT